MARGLAPAHSASDAIDASDSVPSVLGRGASVRGRVHGDGDLRVEGSIEGGVRVSGDLEIDEGGSIAGDVEAGSLVVSGQLAGDAAVSGSITVRSTAQVTGNLGGGEILLEEGAAFAGRIEAEFDMPAELSGDAARLASARPVGRGHR